MKTTPLVLTLALTLAATAVCWASDTKNIEQAIRDLDDQASKAAAAKDVDKVVAIYSDDAIVLPPNASGLTSKEAVREMWKGLLTTPGLAISWKSTRVEVAKSGDMAYSSGTYEVTTKDPSGTPVNDHGKYLEVWEKQANGEWKCGADMWNSDVPVAAEKK